MSDEFKNDEFDNENDATTLQKIKKWLQENLRIIVSVLIVALIASSIYSYSKRGEKVATNTGDKNVEIEKILDDISNQNEEGNKEEQNADEEKQAVTEEAATTENEQVSDANENQEEVIKPEPENKEEAQVTNEDSAKTQPQTEAVTKETENSFIESASPGNGLTNLARKALAHYLEKNPDSSLTPEHKIYIEDYLRKNVNYQGRIYTGTTVEFSKDLIKKAIDASKNLNNAQLQNLHKYAVNVQF